MIEAYFAQLEGILRDFPNIQSYSLTQKIYNLKNAPHHKDSEAFPHHKHTLIEVQGSREPTLHDILLEIAQLERVGNRDQVRRKLTPGE